MTPSKRYHREIRERAVRLVLDHEEEYTSQWAAIESIAQKFGCTSETLRRWVRRAERDYGRCEGLTMDERERVKELERESRELNERSRFSARLPRDQRSASVPGPGGVRPPTKVMTRLIDDYRDVYGVEPTCRVIPIVSLTYCGFKAREADPSLRSQRAKRDETPEPEIQRVWDENLEVYGVEKVWRQLNRP